MLRGVKRKYPSWGIFLKNRRSVQYRSAREFCSKVKVGISYPQYSRYEAGDQLPNLDQAVKIAKLLNIPVLETLLEWCLAQVSDGPLLEELRGHLERVKQSSKIPSPLVVPEVTQSNAQEMTSQGNIPVSLERTFVFNRSHKNLFLSNPLFRDIFTYVNAFAPEWIPADEIAAAIGESLGKTRELLDQLNDLGIILLAGDRCRPSKKLFYFPDDSDFFEIRNENLRHNMNALLERIKHEDLSSQRAYRNLVTIDLGPEQAEDVIRQVENLVKSILLKPKLEPVESVYSFCVVFGERYRRSEVLQSLGLTRVPGALGDSHLRQIDAPAISSE